MPNSAKRVFASFLVIFFTSCDSNRKGPAGGRDLSLVFGGDDGGGDLSYDVNSDLLQTLPLPDLTGLESGTYQADLAIDRDASGCLPGQMGAACTTMIDPNAGCGPVEDCIANGGGTGNGLDDDCNGKVDDGCSCTPGDVRRCFVGPPGKRGVGACTDGTQTCIGSSEFGVWDDCVGSIGPNPETCDGLDNDCNGCADDQLCCSGGVLCPGPNDPRIAAVAPFSTKMYHGPDFFTGNAVSWSWTIEGGPCDKLFASPSFTPVMNPPPQSYKVMGANTQDLSIFFTLSGDYTVTLTIVDNTGHTYTCKWVQHVIGPGVRFELCWDHQGNSSQGGADLDLHVHRSGTTTPWFGTTSLVDTTTPCANNGKCTPPNRFTCDTSNNNCGGKHCCAQQKPTLNADDCMWGNCTAGEYFTDAANTQFPNLYPGNPAPAWGYGSSVIGNCSGSLHGYLWSNASLNACKNPRLDIDNILNVGVPENTNIDNPANGDTFRAMVHYYGSSADYFPAAQCSLFGAGIIADPNGSGFCVYSNSNMFTSDGSYVKVEGSGASAANLVVHPLVNIYCGGSLKATYGQTPNLVTGFDFGTATFGGEMWRVADVTATVDASGTTTDCVVHPIHPPGTNAGYYVTPKSNTSTAY